MTSNMRDSRATLKLTSGGSSATLEKDPIVMPRASWRPCAVITTTGDGTRRIEARNVLGSSAMEGSGDPV
jgi:hypothetical protein